MNHSQNNFNVGAPVSGLLGQYLDKEVFFKALPGLEEHEMLEIWRMWVIQGIPWAFREEPLSFERMRTWLAKRLDVLPTEINLCGSARVGFSMSPTDKFGRDFGVKSDLDLFIVSLSLFGKVSEDVHAWQSAVTTGRPLKGKYEPDNINILPKTLERGFADVKYLPSDFDTSRVKDATWRLQHLLDRTANVQTPPKRSIRVYRDWNAVTKKVKIDFQGIRSFARKNHVSPSDQRS